MTYRRFSTMLATALVASACGDDGVGGDGMPDGSRRVSLTVGEIRAASDLEGLVLPDRDVYLGVEVTVTVSDEPGPIVPVTPVQFNLVFESRAVRLAFAPAARQEGACGADVALTSGGTVTCEVWFDIDSDARFVAVAFNDGTTVEPVEAPTPINAVPEVLEIIADLDRLELEQFCLGLDYPEVDLVDCGTYISAVGDNPGLCINGLMPGFEFLAVRECYSYRTEACTTAQVEACVNALRADPCALTTGVCTACTERRAVDPLTCEDLLGP